MKGAAVEKATNPGRRFIFFSRLRRSFSRALRANFAATPLLRPARQNRHATQATECITPSFLRACRTWRTIRVSASSSENCTSGKGSLTTMCLRLNHVNREIKKAKSATIIQNFLKILDFPKKFENHYKRKTLKDHTIELLLIKHIPSTIIRRLQIFSIVSFSTSTGTEQLSNKAVLRAVVF